MILLDTHVWVWWVLGSDRLKPRNEERLKQAEKEGLGVSIMSCWEVAKLVEVNRLELPLSVKDWLSAALRYPGVELLDLTLDTVLEATQLPGNFHRDPVDQLLVATSRCRELPLATADSAILAYEHVQALKF